MLNYYQVHVLFHYQNGFSKEGLPPEKKINVRKFGSYTSNFKEYKNIPTDILDGLYQVNSKKPTDKPKSSINLLCYALLLRYSFKAILITSGQVDLIEYWYFEQLSRGGLVQPPTDLLHYVSKSSTILGCICDVTSTSLLPERELAEHTLLEKTDYPCSFLCENHESFTPKVNRIVTNIYFNNEPKKFLDTLQKDSVKEFKQQQAKGQRVS